MCQRIKNLSIKFLAFIKDKFIDWNFLIILTVLILIFLNLKLANLFALFTLFLIGNDLLLASILSGIVILIGIALYLVWVRNKLCIYLKQKWNLNDAALGKIKIKANGYFVFAVLVGWVLLNVGTIYLNIEFKEINNKFHFDKTPYDPTKDFYIGEFVRDISGIICKSQNNYERFVVGDTSNCQFQINYTKGSEDTNLTGAELDSLVKLTGIHIFGEQLNYSEDEQFELLSLNRHYGFDLFIPNENSVRYLVMLKFTNSTKGRPTNSSYAASINLPGVLTYSEYEDWKEKKIAWLVGLLSLIFISVFIGVKEIRDLIENK